MADNIHSFIHSFVCLLGIARFMLLLYNVLLTFYFLNIIWYPLCVVCKRSCYSYSELHNCTKIED